MKESKKIYMKIKITETTGKCLKHVLVSFKEYQVVKVSPGGSLHICKHYIILRHVFSHNIGEGSSGGEGAKVT